MMGLQFGLTARFRHVTAPLGEDVIYHFHRQISLAALALMDASYRNNPAIFPPADAVAKCRYAQYLGEDPYRAFQDAITRVRAA